MPRFEHLLIDQTEQNPESVAGTLGARLAQLALMAEHRRSGWKDLLQQVMRLMDELHPSAGTDGLAPHVEYLLFTMKLEERQQEFAEALGRTTAPATPTEVRPTRSNQRVRVQTQVT